MKRTNIYWPDELLERVRVHAEKTGTTSSDVMRTAVEHYLALQDMIDGPRQGITFSVHMDKALRGVKAEMRKVSENLIEVTVSRKPKDQGGRDG